MSTLPGKRGSAPALKRFVDGIAHLNVQMLHLRMRVIKLREYAIISTCLLAGTSPVSETPTMRILQSLAGGLFAVAGVALVVEVLIL